MPLKSKTIERKKSPPLFNGRLITLENGLRFDAVEAGEGDPIFLVHGICGSIEHWEPLIGELSKNHRVIAYNRMGYGDSTPPSESYAYDSLSNARDLLSLMDHLEIERATLIGWSLGGAIVQQVGLSHPGRVERIVLVSSIGPAMPQVPYRIVDRIFNAPFGARLLKFLLGKRLGLRTVRIGYKAAFSKFSKASDELIESSLHLLGDPDTIATLIEEWHSMEPDELEPEKLDVPALIVQGEQDVLVPIEVAKDLEKRISKSESFIVPEAGHMAAYSHAGIVGKRIAAFIAST